MENGKIGHFTYDPEEPVNDNFSFAFTPLAVEEMAVQCNSQMLNSVCRQLQVAHGPNRVSAATQIHKLMIGTTVPKKGVKATGSGGAQTKTDLMQELLALGVLKGVKKTGKKAGSTMAISDLTMEELQCEIDKAKAATEAAVKALKVVVDDSSGTEGENEDQEVEDEEEDGSAEEEEAAESKAEEVGYFAHL